MLGISLIIPTFNKIDRLSLVLNSLKNQNLDNKRFEVVIIDDGSTDGTETLIHNNLYNYPIKYIKQNNYGRSSARNNGILNSDHDIIVFSDDDLILPSDFLINHLKAHESQDNIIVHGKIFNLPFMKFFKNPSNGTVYNDMDRNLKLDGLNSKLLYDQNLLNMTKIYEQSKVTYFENIIESTFKGNYSNLHWLGFTGGNVSCSKKIFNFIGLFDDEFGLNWGCEDLELGYRAFKKGYKFIYSSAACNFHMAHYRQTFKAELHKSLEYFYLKYNDNYIYYLDKLLLGEIRDIKKYIDFCNANQIQL